MSSATDTRDVLVAALTNAGLDVTEDQTGQWVAPTVMIEAGNPWIARAAMAPGAAHIRWRIVCIAAKGQDAKHVAVDLLGMALVAYNVLVKLTGWKTSDVSGLRAVAESDGAYVAVELVTEVPIDITEGL